MNEKEIMDLEDKYTINSYYKRPVVIVKGKGAEVWDINGRKYIDCVAGHGVAILGHCHPEIVKAIRDQAERLISCPGTFYNDLRAKLAKKIAEISPSGLNKVFFSNSGAESIECSIKLAKAYTGRTRIIAAKRGFHGRTVGALSLTWKAEYRGPFQSLLGSYVDHVPFGDEEALKERINRETMAVVLEPIQGEAGVFLPPDGYLKAVRDLCDDYGAVLIFDEVQTGFGRTGKIFACEHWKVYPDILCLAKGIAGGLPMGITVAKEEIANSFKPGMHGSTYGGNPLCCASALAAIDILIKERLYKRAEILGSFFKGELEKIAKEHLRLVREVRGLGLMLAIQFRFSLAPKVILKSIDRGVLLLPSGKTIIRLLPPLVITKDQIKTVLEVIDQVLWGLENGGG